MKIAIQAADLDSSRIDGTRVYLLNILKYLGKISKSDEFIIYHKKKFNTELIPAKFSNYIIRKIFFPIFWTQIKFAWDIQKNKVDALWMPMHNIPFFKNRKIKTVVTIHDLAFKQFSETFPKKDLFKLNFLTNLAVRKSDKIIAVSKSTKKDILKFYPKISPKKIKVIYHGFNAELFQKKYHQKKINKTLTRYRLHTTKYILYVGAIQPKKNLKTLIKAFELFKKNNANSELKLVLSGGKAWNWKETVDAVENSSERNDIILTGRVSFNEISILYKNASIFVFPSLYEGFGIPILEAFATKVPVITSKNSSLEEVGGDAVEYFDSLDAKDLSVKIKNILDNEMLRKEMIKKGIAQLKKFSWEKCTRETLNFIKE